MVTSIFSKTICVFLTIVLAESLTPLYAAIVYSRQYRLFLLLFPKFLKLLSNTHSKTTSTFIGIYYSSIQLPGNKMFISSCFCNKLPQNLMILKQIYHSTVLEIRSPKPVSQSKCQQFWFLLEAVGDNLYFICSSFERLMTLGL